MQTQTNSEFIGTFAIFGLSRALADFDCGQFEQERCISWYWRTAWTWTPQGSQEEFNRYARRRVSDHVGYTKRRKDAWGTIDRLFDDARDQGVTFEQVIQAVTFLCPTQEMPYPVHVNGSVTLVDLTKREDSPKILMIDTSFLPTLKALYPFERIDDVVVKQIPVGTVSRELNLVTLPFWKLFPDAEFEERKTAIEFGAGGRLDWTTTNLNSKWRGIHAAKYQSRFWKEPMEKQHQDGTVYLSTPDSKVMGGYDLTNLGQETPFGKATATASLLNKTRQDAYEKGH